MYATLEPSLIPDSKPQRWLFPALLVSGLLHLFVLSLDYPRSTTPDLSRISITLRNGRTETPVTVASPLPAETRKPEPVPRETAESRTIKKNVNTVVEAPAAHTGSLPRDWKAAVRSAIRSQQAERNIYEAPPLEHYRLDREVDAPRIPELADAFAPLQRAVELCPAEAIFDLGNRQIVLPTVRACTEADEKALQDEIIQRRLEKRAN